MASVEADSGSVAGKHRVAFGFSLPGADPMGALARVMHRKYSSLETSGITVDVKPQRNNSLTIEVERDPKPPNNTPANVNP